MAMKKFRQHKTKKNQIELLLKFYLLSKYSIMSLVYEFCKRKRKNILKD